MFDPEAEMRRIYSLSLPEVKHELLLLLTDYSAWTDDWKMTLLDTLNRVHHHAELDPDVFYDDKFDTAVIVLTMVTQNDHVETVTRYLNYLRRYLDSDAPTVDGDFPYGNPNGWPEDVIEPDDEQ